MHLQPERGQRPSTRLIIICGLSFAGKSTLGNAICAAFEYPHVDVDETKVDLYGPGLDDTDLNPDEWARIYSVTDDLIVAHLRKGDCVVDASRNFRRRERDHARSIANRMNAETVTVHVDAPESLVRKRWARNRNQQTRRVVSPEGFEEIISVMEPPSEDEEALIFRHNDDTEEWLREHAISLSGKQHGPAT